MLRFKIFSSVCALGGLKEENMGVGLRWYLLNSPITTQALVAAKEVCTLYC